MFLFLLWGFFLLDRIILAFQVFMVFYIGVCFILFNII